jgi:hypothetical protein
MVETAMHTKAIYSDEDVSQDAEDDEVEENVGDY